MINENPRKEIDKKLSLWLSDSQGLLAVPIFYRVGFIRRMFYDKKQHEFSGNYRRAKQHLLNLDLDMYELKRYKSILVNTLDPYLDLILPMISFLCGGVISVVVSEFILVNLKVNEELSNWQELWMSLVVLGSFAVLIFCQTYRIKYISMKGKLSVLLEEIIDEKEAECEDKMEILEYKRRLAKRKYSCRN